MSRRTSTTRVELDDLIAEALGTLATGIVKGDASPSPFTVVGALVVDVDTNTTTPINCNTSTKESN